MIIDTTNDELLINGQRWQRGGYLLATAYSTDQINITARDGRVIGKAIEWDRILDKDKNTFGLDRDGTVTALTNIFNSQVKSPYKIDALRDVEDGTAAYGEIMIYRSPGEWQYEVLEQYHGAYDSEAATLRSGATATLELYYTAQADGDGISELSQSNTPASGYQIIRKLYYSERAQQDPDTGTWVQFADVAANTSFNDAKNTLLAYLKERTGGTVPISLKMTWEEVEIYNGLLDSYGGAAAAYSVRRLSSSYEGSLIQVERASDNTTQDIGYDSNGDLDTAAIATFCSGTNCTVRTWYDQSSNGNDAVQTTQANQPTIYTGGAVILENGEAAMNLTDGQGFTMTSAIGAGADKYPFLVHAADASDTSWSLYAESVSGNVTPLAEDGSTSTLLQSSPYDPLNAIFKDGSALTLTTRDALHANYVSAGQSLTTMHFEGSPGVAILFNRNGGRNYTGTVQELIFYTSDQSSNRSGIETNINDYFGIYTPFTTGLLDDYGGAAAAYSLRRLSSTYTGPLIRVRRASDNAEQDISADIEGNLNTGALAAFCSGTDGFVKTWYCQSGNGNDATQTTAANQPKIYDSSTGVVLENGEPALEFDGTSDQLSASVTIGSAAASTSFVVVNPDTISPNKRIYNMHDGATGDERNSSFVNSQFNIYDGTNGLTTGTTVAGTQYLITSRFVTGDGTIHANGTLQGTSASITQKAVNTLSIGKQDVGATFYLDGNMQEFVLYASDQSSNRSGIETNINDFYNIYP